MKQPIHFANENWSDFVRGAVSGDAHRAMQAHLQSGCADCAAAVATFQAVVRLAVVDGAQPVPMRVAEQARAIFETRPSNGWLDALEVIRAKLVPGVEWRVAGVRSAGPDVVDVFAERMLFTASGYSIDLKVDAPTGGEGGEIIGQISSEPSQAQSVDGVLVQVVSGRGRTLGETTTNRFGEFFVDYAGQKNVSLRFAVKPRNHRIDVLLKVKRGSKSIHHRS